MQNDEFATLICEGACNPGLKAADDDLSAMPAFVKGARYTSHKATFSGSQAFCCQRCGWHRRFGGNGAVDGGAADRNVAFLNAQIQIVNV